MKTTKLPLLLAALLAGVALLSAPLPASACVFYCWHTTGSETCCQVRSCDIVCNGEAASGPASGTQELQSPALLPPGGEEELALPFLDLQGPAAPVAPAGGELAGPSSR